jgi:hypothetical protein
MEDFVRHIRPTLSIKQRQRIDRMMSEPIYLLEAKVPNPIESTRMLEAVVCGSTANVYQTVVDAQGKVSCSCPDFYGHARTADAICKHAAFLLIKAGGLRNASVLLRDRRLRSAEVEMLRTNLARAGRHEIPRPRDEAVIEIQIREGADECAICFDGLKGCADALVVCRTCSNPVHRRCFNRWVQSCDATRTPLSCVYCRAQMPRP